MKKVLILAAMLATSSAQAAIPEKLGNPFDTCVRTMQMFSPVKLPILGDLFNPPEVGQIGLGLTHEEIAYSQQVILDHRVSTEQFGLGLTHDETPLYDFARLTYRLVC